MKNDMPIIKGIKIKARIRGKALYRGQKIGKVWDVHIPYKRGMFHNLTFDTKKGALDYIDKIIKKSSIFDLDNDGVPNLLDCKPGDPTKQDFGGGEEPSYLLDGYDIEDYYFTGTGYELRPEAKPSKSWVKEQKRKRR